jgi:cytochrome c biogenesis protein CcmG/thiol:disulfide interchange protein DsbE
VFLIILGTAGSVAAAAQANYPQAPAFSLKDLNGKTMALEDFKGKILFLNFWATWCPPCRAEIPDFIEFYGQNKDKGLEVVGLSVDNLTPQQLLSFVQKNKMTYPVAFATEKIIRDYEPGEFIPTTIVIDRQGRIRHKQVGAMNKETLAGIFQKLASEK